MSIVVLKDEKGNVIGEKPVNAASIDDIMDATDYFAFKGWTLNSVKGALVELGYNSDDALAQEVFANIKEQNGYALLNLLEGRTDHDFETVRMIVKEAMKRKVEESAEEGSFSYGGYYFVPVGVLNGIPFDQVVRSTMAFVNPHMSSFRENDIPYTYEGFYKAAGNTDADIFRCIETDGLYIPGSEELFGYTGSYEPYNP